MDIKLSESLINVIDLSVLKRFLGPKQSEPFIKNPEKGFNYYKTLAYLSVFVDNSIIFDIGSGHGHSALALSYNESNKILSFDVDRSRDIQIFNRENIEFRLGNALTHPDILKCPLIYLDVNHDGVFELEVIEFLWDNQWPGILVLDDIFDYPDLKKVWDLISLPKYDITKYGHFSGFGLVNFSETQNKIIME